MIKYTELKGDQEDVYEQLFNAYAAVKNELTDKMSYRFAAMVAFDLVTDYVYNHMTLPIPAIQAFEEFKENREAIIRDASIYSEDGKKIVNLNSLIAKELEA